MTVKKETIVAGLGMVRDSMNEPLPRHFFTVKKWHIALADLTDEQVKNGFDYFIKTTDGNKIPRPNLVRSMAIERQVREEIS